MDDDLFISILGPISSQSIQELLKKQVQAECVFTQQPDCEDEDQFVPANMNYVLQIRQNFLLQCEPKSKKICGGIQLTLQYQFQIKRCAFQPQDHIGKPYALIIYFPQQNQNDDQVIIKFGVNIEGANSLQKFAKCLQTKLIYQLDMHSNFRVTQRIFFSTAASLYAAIRLKDKKQLVIKCIRKDLFAMTGRDINKGIERQYGIPKQFQHQGICKYYGVFCNDKSVYVIMERLYVNFFNFLNYKLYKCQEDLKTYFKKICIAVSILHQNCIMHRDIKPQNIMMRKFQSNNFQPVLIDFGLSQYEQKKPYLFIRCGTPGYAAPQIAKATHDNISYNRSCDIFSLGCILHLLLLRKPVFEGTKIEQIIQKNGKCQIDQQGQKYKNLKPAQRNILFGMLEKQPSKRLTINEVLDHNYFKANAYIQVKSDQNQDLVQHSIQQIGQITKS